MCEPNPPGRRTPTPALHERSRARTGVVAAVAIALACLASPAPAATIFVTDSTDSIPPVEGSLRWAIQLSESNGEPDEIFVLIDVASITLVAPLPALTEGRLQLAFPPSIIGPEPSQGSLTLDGAGVVRRALTVLSAGNVISGLRFENFVGTEIVSIQGAQAGDNLIVGCGFFGPGATGVADGAGIRVIPANDGEALPQGLVIRSSFFDGLGSAVLFEGSQAAPSTPSARPTADLGRNWFGLAATGEPSGVGNRRAVDARRSGAIRIWGNTIAGPGDGIVLDAAGGSWISNNVLGVRRSVDLTCVGLDGPAIAVRQSRDVVVDRNMVRCSGAGIALGPGVEDTTVDMNRFGGPDIGSGNLGDGVRLEGVLRAGVRANVIEGNGGAGIAIFDPQLPGARLSCNRVSGNAGLPIDAPLVATPSPVITGATPLVVTGDLLDLAPPAGVEVFGDDGAGPVVYQGYVDVAQDQTSFSHLLPVLGLSVSKANLDPAAAVIKFATTDPASHVATATNRPRAETSEVSAAFPAAALGPVYDVIRGRVKALARAAAGGVDLGQVVCLGAGIPGSDLPVVDPDRPPLGDAFFYLARRRSTASNPVGTYDPAVCFADAGTFSGPRRAAGGDCGM